MRGGRRWPRWIFAGLAALLVLAIIGDVFIKATRNESSAPPSDTPAVPVDSGQPPGVNPNDPAVGENGQDSDFRSVTRKNRPKDAVNAASQAVSGVSVGYLLPENLFRQTINDLVVRESHAKLLAAYRGNPAVGVPGVGESLAAVWNYNDASDALRNAEYRVTTKKFRVDSFDAKNGRAVVYLYTITHFNRRVVTEGNVVLLESYYTPSINVVKMRYVDGRWRYVSSPDTPRDREPAFTQTGMSFKDMEALYNDYLKEGYLDFG